MLCLGAKPRIPGDIPKENPLALAISRRSKAMASSMLVAEANLRTPWENVPAFPPAPRSSHSLLEAAIDSGDVSMMEFLLKGNSELRIEAQRGEFDDLCHTFQAGRSDWLPRLYERCASYTEGVASLHFEEHSKMTKAYLDPYRHEGESSFVGMETVALLELQHAITTSKASIILYRTGLR